MSPRRGSVSILQHLELPGQGGHDGALRREPGGYPGEAPHRPGGDEEQWADPWPSQRLARGTWTSRLGSLLGHLGLRALGWLNGWVALLDSPDAERGRGRGQPGSPQHPAPDDIGYEVDTEHKT